jgi:hypothetical protein
MKPDFSICEHTCVRYNKLTPWANKNSYHTEKGTEPTAYKYLLFYKDEHKFD